MIRCPMIRIGFSFQALKLFLLFKTFHKQLKNGPIGDTNIGGVNVELGAKPQMGTWARSSAVMAMVHSLTQPGDW